MRLRQRVASLPFQTLAPSLIVVLIFLFAYSYTAWRIFQRFEILERELTASTHATRSLLEISRLRDKSKELLLLFWLTGETRFIGLLNEAEMNRSLQSSRLQQEVKEIASNEILIESFFASLGETRNLRKTLLEAIARRDRTQTSLLFEDYSIFHEINSAHLADLHAVVHSRLIRAEREMRSLLEKLPWLLLALLVFTLVVAGGTIHFYRRRVLKPLSLLQNGLSAVSEGHLGEPLIVPDAPTEIEEMLENFNLMTARLDKATVELTRAREEAMRAANVKSEFLANMSHEIRTPLNVVIGLADLLFDREADAETRHELDILRKSSGMLLEVVNDILDYSRLESGHVPVAQDSFDLHELIEGVGAMITPLATSKRLSIRIQIAPEVPSQIIGDCELLKRALLNLVNNAVKFTAKGSVSIDARTCTKGSQMVLILSVIDTGIGIPLHKLETLFGRFVQVDTSTTRTYGGTGLGLAIVKQIATLLKGSVEVRSIPQKGSTFEICLPLTVSEDLPADTLRDQKAEAPCTSSFKRIPRILLADDSPDNRFLIRSYLKGTGAEIVEAENGRQALEEFRRGAFDIVLMDIQMPEMDGYQATREIRKCEAERGLRRTTVIALTAFALREEVQRSLENGCDAHISKPIRKPQLMRTIEQSI